MSQKIVPKGPIEPKSQQKPYVDNYNPLYNE